MSIRMKIIRDTSILSRYVPLNIKTNDDQILYIINAEHKSSQEVLIPKNQLITLELRHLSKRIAIKNNTTQIKVALNQNLVKSERWMLQSLTILILNLMTYNFLLINIISLSLIVGYLTLLLYYSFINKEKAIKVTLVPQL